MTGIFWLPFQWQDADLGEQHFAHAALFVLGTLPALDGLTGWFQLDLGAPTTMLYEQAFTATQQARIAKIPHLPQEAIINGQPVPLLRAPLHIGPWEVPRLAWYEGFGDNSAMPDGRPILGTVGADFVRQHILVLDFPHQRLSRLKTLPSTWETLARWTALRQNENGHVLVQVEVEEQPRWVMFDTGSSIFELLTSASLWQRLSRGDATSTLTISAWGQAMEVSGGPARARFALARAPLAVHTVYYLNDPTWDAYFTQHNIVGIMGNAPFMENVIVLDFRSGRFGVLPEA